MRKAEDRTLLSGIARLPAGPAVDVSALPDDDDDDLVREVIMFLDLGAILGCRTTLLEACLPILKLF